MKVQIDIESDLWAKFKAKVHHEGKTLGSVVPTIFEPALKAYLDPPKCSECAPPILATKEEAERIIRESASRGFQIVHSPAEKTYTEAAETFKEIAKPLPQLAPPTTTIETAPIEFTGPTTEKKLVAVERISPPLPTVKRCDLCDQVVDRLFASSGKRVCYTCWRAELTAGQ